MGTICKVLNGVHNNVLLGQIMISNSKSKRVNENIVHISIIKSLYMQIFTFVSVSDSVLLELITISNTRSERVNENITIITGTCQE